MTTLTTTLALLVLVTTVCAELCVMNRTSNSLRCCTIEDGQDRLDAPMMRYCASISCVKNTAPIGLVTASHLLQFERAIIGQGLFEEPAKEPLFRLPHTKGTERSLGEALIQCEQSTVRTACLYINATQFAATDDGACSACLEAANWNFFTGSPPISKARFLIKCFTLFRNGYVAPTTTATQPTVPAGPVVSPSTAGVPGPFDGEAMSTQSPNSGGVSDTNAATSKDDIGLIAGVAGGCAVLLLIIIVVVLLWRRNRKPSSEPHARVEANSAPALAMEPERSSGNMSSARSSGFSARTSAPAFTPISAPAAPIARTQYEDFDDMQDIKDKDPRMLSNSLERTPEQQRQIDSIMQRNRLQH